MKEKKSVPNRGFSPDKIRRIALMGLLFAVALVLSVVEASVPVPVPVPGVRLGLSNIVVMYSLFFLKKSDAVLLAFLKGFFVFLTRGAIAGFLSICGGFLSIIVMVMLMLAFREKISYFILSIFGAVSHNIGQITAASVILQTSLWSYFPILLVSGIIVGITTSILLKVTLPVLEKLNLK